MWYSTSIHECQGKIDIYSPLQKTSLGVGALKELQRVRVWLLACQIPPLPVLLGLSMFELSSRIGSYAGETWGEWTTKSASGNRNGLVSLSWTDALCLIQRSTITL